MGFVKKAVIGIAAIFAIIILVIGYYGFIPGLSGLMGANTPRDLGITYTQDNVERANGKLGVTYAELPPNTPDSGSLVMENYGRISVGFSDTELTALFNDHADNWGNYLMDDIQVRFNPDGTTELSGKIKTGRLRGFAESKGYDVTVLDRPELNYIKSEPSLYIKGDLTIIDGVVSADVEQVQIGRLDLPADQVELVEEFLVYYTQKVADPPNLLINYFDTRNGECDVQAAIPKKVSFAP